MTRIFVLVSLATLVAFATAGEVVTGEHELDKCGCPVDRPLCEAVPSYELAAKVRVLDKLSSRIVNAGEDASQLARSEERYSVAFLSIFKGRSDLSSPFEIISTDNGRAECMVPELLINGLYLLTANFTDGGSAAKIDVCGANIRWSKLTRDNLEYLHGSDLSCAAIQPLALCTEFDVCPTAEASAPSDAVCGSNGRTYANRCLLEKDACLHPELNLAMASAGPCELVDICQKDALARVCEDQQLAPVCGSDGRTYSSECEMRLESCKRSVVINIMHGGLCEADVCGNVRCMEGFECKLTPDDVCVTKTCPLVPRCVPVRSSQPTSTEEEAPKKGPDEEETEMQHNESKSTQKVVITESRY